MGAVLYTLHQLNYKCRLAQVCVMLLAVNDLRFLFDGPVLVTIATTLFHM